MPLNEMTVGKVEWGVEALEGWGGPGVGGRVSLADRQDSPNQVATKQPKSWTRTLPFLNHDGTVDDQAMATRESGGRRAARSVEAATTAAGCGAQWGVFLGGKGGQFWRCRGETDSRDGRGASFRPLVLWCCRWCCRCDSRVGQREGDERKERLEFESRRWRTGAERILELLREGCAMGWDRGV